MANPAVGNTRLWEALNYTCGQGGADCMAIQPGAACFQPDTMVAHASYAFNSYYQIKGRTANNCYFNGAGTVVYQPQSEFTIVDRLLLECSFLDDDLTSVSNIAEVGNCILPPTNG